MSASLFASYEEPTFNSSAVRPFECLSGGWQLIKDQYFLFVGMFLVIVILVTCIPFTGIIQTALDRRTSRDLVEPRRDVQPGRNYLKKEPAIRARSSVALPTGDQSNN